MKNHNDGRPPAPTDDQPGFDNRLKERFITKGHWTIEQIDGGTVILSDIEEVVVSFEPTQPALGLFDEETLARVQKNFPYKR
jgi:hypothetical protein